MTVNGGTEDGYDAISFALANYTFRGGAVKMFVLITDEDRDTLSTDTYASILSLMNTNNVIFATINDYTVTDNLAAQCIGSDSVTLGSLVYKANGTGGYIHTTTLSALSGFGTTVTDYANLAIARGGTYWNLNILRNGGNDALSFTAAFTTIVKNQILYAVSWVFSYWDIGGVLYYTNPATFVVNADTSAVVYLV